jgi:hypothetical protein
LFSTALLYDTAKNTPAVDLIRPPSSLSIYRLLRYMVLVKDVSLSSK